VLAWQLLEASDQILVCTFVITTSFAFAHLHDLDFVGLKHDWGTFWNYGFLVILFEFQGWPGGGRALASGGWVRQGLPPRPALEFK